MHSKLNDHKHTITKWDEIDDMAWWQENNAFNPTGQAHIYLLDFY